MARWKQQLESLQADIQQAEARRASEGAADAERRAAHDAAVAANLAQISEQRDALARQLNASSAALEASQKQLALEGAAVERLTLREAELLGQLAQEADSRATLERTHRSRRRAPRREADERHASGAGRRGIRSRAALQRQSEEAAAQAAATREALERQLSDAGAALEQAQAAPGSRRGRGGTTARGARSQSSAPCIDRRCGGSRRTRSPARRRPTARRSSGPNSSARPNGRSARAREQSLQDDLARETQARTSVERELTEARAEFARGRRRLLDGRFGAPPADESTRRTPSWRRSSPPERDPITNVASPRARTRSGTSKLERETLRQSLDAMRGRAPGAERPLRPGAGWSSSGLQSSRRIAAAAPVRRIRS